MSATLDPFTRVFSSFDNIRKQIISPGSDPEEVETIEMLNESIRRFGGRHIDGARIDAEASIPPQILKLAAEMGLFGLTIEKPYGGAGLSMKGTCRVIETLGSIDSSVGVCIGLHAGLGLRGLIHFGSPALKKRYLPDLATGKLIASFPVTESEAGSDIASVRTTAVEDDDDLVINGSKIFATNGGIAGVATIVARTPQLGSSRRGHSMILVPLDRPGVHRDAEEHKLGIRGTSTCSIHLEDVRVGQDHILGTPSQGLNHLNHVLSWGRTLMAAGCLGLARAAFGRALEQVTTRRQFNRVIGEFGMVREMLARMRSRIHAMESAIRLATRLEDEQPGTIGWESSVVKVFCSESAWLVCDDTVQVHGGSGFIEGTGVARLLRDCRITRIFEGANELLRFHLAAAACTWKLEPILQGKTLASGLDRSFREPGEVFDSLLRSLAETLIRKKRAHGLKVFQRQMDQRRMADAALSLYVMLAVITRAQAELEAGRLSDEMLWWTRHSTHELAKQTRLSLNELEANADDLVNQIAAAECRRVGCCLKENEA